MKFAECKSMVEGKKLNSKVKVNKIEFASKTFLVFWLTSVLSTVVGCLVFYYFGSLTCWTILLVSIMSFSVMMYSALVALETNIRFPKENRNKEFKIKV